MCDRACHVHLFNLVFTSTAFASAETSLMEQEAKLMLVLFSSYPRNNVTAVEPKVVIRDRFMAGDELQQNHAEAVDVALLCQLLRDVVPNHTRTK